MEKSSEDIKIENLKLEDEKSISENDVQISIEPLMPELEILVKKNPNQLIGCGG